MEVKFGGLTPHSKTLMHMKKLHIKFIKEILGVHCKATNNGCRAELNRTPLKSKILFSIFNFFKHILDADNTLLKEIYINSKEFNPWVKKFKKIINNLGFSFMINNTSLSKNNLGQIKQRIQDQCLQDQNSNIYKTTKLEFFLSIYMMGTRPPYVDILQNKEDRAAVCKIRISAHSLFIKQGRHLNIPKKKGIVRYVNQDKLKMKIIFY